MSELKNNFFLSQTWGLFAGYLPVVHTHRHYALQISVSNTPIIVNTLKNISFFGQRIIIKSNIPHSFQCTGLHLTLLLNPASPIGHTFTIENNTNEISISYSNFTNDLLSWLIDFEGGSMKFSEIISNVAALVHEYKCKCEKESHIGDDRIMQALIYLEDHFDENIPLNKAARLHFLSPSRFIHLFRQKTGISYRRYQLWNKLVKSLPLLQSKSVTEVAYTTGFSDHAHYIRTFKETFGVSPGILLKK